MLLVLICISPYRNRKFLFDMNKVTTSCTVDGEALDLAKKLNINISQEVNKILWALVKAHIPEKTENLDEKLVKAQLEVLSIQKEMEERRKIDDQDKEKRRKELEKKLYSFEKS